MGMGRAWVPGANPAHLALRGQDHQAACSTGPTPLSDREPVVRPRELSAQTLAGGDAGVLGWEVNTMTG